MKIKLRNNLIIMESVFLLIVMGGSALVYGLFAASYYNRAKSRVVMEAYQDIKEVDLADLQESDLQMLRSYEDEHFSFTIADENFTPVYYSWRNDKEAVRRNILINQDKFSEEPVVIQRGSRNYEGTRLLGKFTQGGVLYYVCIKETTGSMYGVFFYTERFLLIVILVTVIVGSVVMYIQGRKIAKPIETMAIVSKKIAQHDFSARVQEKTYFKEVDELTRNFNDMADQLEFHIKNMEKQRMDLEYSNEWLQKQNEQKEQLEKMRREFNANISHELKTPLAVISSQVEMLQLLEGKDPEKSSYYYSSIREEIDKMSDMIHKLLKLSAAEHKLEQLDMQEINLAETSERLIMKYDAMFRKKQMKRICRMGQECTVLGDAGCLEEAMSNYILNAFNHTGDNGRLEISVYREEQEVVFRVYNEGSQISAKDMEHIWDHYYQGQETENHAGLGLYIVKTIILLHQGRCGAENKENGVEFWFALPAYQEEK